MTTLQSRTRRASRGRRMLAAGALALLGACRSNDVTSPTVPHGAPSTEERVEWVSEFDRGTASDATPVLEQRFGETR